MSAAIVRDNRKRFYDVDTSASTGVMYVNWMEARNLRGFLWMWRNIPAIYNVLKRADGLSDSYMSLVSPTKFVIISYWEDETALRRAYQDKGHIAMMRWVFQHPDALILGNETYHAPFSTRYLNEAGGFGKLGHVEAWSGERFTSEKSKPEIQEALS